MKKVLLLTLALISYLNSFSQTSYCTPYYQNGCLYMGISSLTIDSINGTTKFNTSNLSEGCNSFNGYSDFTYSNPIVSQSFMPGGNYSATINSSNSSYNQYFAFLIDLNTDGDFLDANESYFSINVGLSGTFNFSIPSETSVGKKRVRILSSYYFIDINSVCNTLSWGESEDFLIKVGISPMSFVSSTTNAIPNPTTVVPNDTSKYVLQVQINMDGSLNPQTLKNLKFTTSGTSKVSSIKNAKLWYSGSSYTLNYGSQKVGSTILAPKDTFNFALSQKLVDGMNVFWLTYDIDSKAAPTDTLKATCEEVTIETSKYTPSIKNGAAGGLIVDYCTPKFKNGYQINIQSIAIGNISETNYYGNIDNYYAPNPYNYLNLYQGGNSGFSIKNKNQKLYYAIYIDYNKDGLYTGNGEFINLNSLEPNTSFSGTINPPIDAKLGINRTRVICSDFPLDATSFCLSGDNGEIHDFTTYIISPTNMVIDGSFYYKEGDKILVIPSNNNEILKVNIKTFGSKNPIKAKQMSFNSGNTNKKYISNAKLWYNNILDDFSTAKQVGNTITTPNETVQFDIDLQLLDNSSNFFWLSYDIPVGTPENEQIEAKPLSFTDQNGKSINITADEQNSYYPQNISGKRVTAVSTTIKDTTIVGCSYKFYDDGGATDSYSNSSYKITFVAPDTMNRMSITFNSLDLGYDGETSDEIELYDGKNYITNLTYIEGSSTFTTTKSDSLTIIFNPQKGNYAGWDANISCAYRCDIDPLELDYKITPQCINEPQIYHQTITKGLYAPYTYKITGNYTVKYFVSNNPTLDTLFNSGLYDVEVTNSKGCTNHLNSSISYTTRNYSVFSNITDPTCPKAIDGSVSLSTYSFNQSTYTIDSLVWFGKNRKGLDKTIDSVGYNQNFSYKLYYNNTCEYGTFSTYSEGYIDTTNDTTEALVLNEKPIIQDSLFTINEIKQSSISIKPLNQNYNYNESARVISPYLTTILPDSIHWVSTPSKAVTITPGDTIANAIWNSNYSGKAVIKAEPFKGVCRGYFSPEMEVLIKPYAKLSSTDSISIFNNDSAKVTLTLAGTKPFTLTYFKPNSEVRDTIKNINTNSFSFYVRKAGTYRLLNLLDSSLTVQKLDTNIVIQIDKISSVTAVINPLKCHKGKTDVGFIIKGGKAPYQIHLADSQIGKFRIINKKSANDSTGIDTSLFAGNYVYRIVDAAKDTSSVYELNIVDTLKAVTIPTIISQISTVPVNTTKLNLTVSSAVAKTSYLWLSSDTILIKTKNTASSATFNIATDKTGIADLSVIAIDANGCKSDTSSSVQLTIYPTVTLASGSNTIFYNETDSLKISFNGSLPATLSIGGFGKNDSIFTLTKSSISIPINKSSTYNLTSAKDINGISAPTNTNEYVLTVDTISAIKLTITGAPCAGKNGNVTAEVTGGKSPYTYYFYSSVKDKGISKADTNLIAGNYSLIIKDAAGFETSVPTKFTISNNSNAIVGPTITIPESSKIITTDTLQSLVSCKPISNISKYKWIIKPSIAGEASDSNSTSNINLAQNYSGDIKISTYGITNEGCITDTSNVVNIVRVGIIKDLTVDKTEIFYSNDTISASVKFTGSGPYKLFYTIDETNFEIDGITSSNYTFKITTPGKLKVIKALDINSIIMEDQIKADIQISLDTISTFTTSVIKKALCSSGKGKIKVVINGGQKPYTVYATNIKTNIIDSISNLNAIDTIDLKIGKYSITFKDAAGYISNLSNEDSITLDNNSIEKLTPIIKNNSDSIITNGKNAEASLSGSISGITNPSLNWWVETLDAGTFSSTTSANTKLKWDKKFSGFAYVHLIATDGTCYSDTATIKIKVKANIELVKKKDSILVNTFGRGPFKVYINETIGQTEFTTSEDTTIKFTTSRVTFIKVIDLSTNDTTLVNTEIVLTQPDITIYDGFSPNGDNHNDLFIIDDLDTTVPSTLHITDELGFEKFTSKGYSYLNNWDGKDNDGNKLEDGVYICTFEYNSKKYTHIIEIRR